MPVRCVQRVSHVGRQVLRGCCILQIHITSISDLFSRLHWLRVHVRSQAETSLTKIFVTFLPADLPTSRDWKCLTNSGCHISIAKPFEHSLALSLCACNKTHPLFIACSAGEVAKPHRSTAMHHDTFRSSSPHEYHL